MNRNQIFSMLGIGLLVFFVFTFCNWLWVGTDYVISKDAEHNGYVTSVTQSTGAFADGDYKVWFKTALESSQEDEYCIDSSHTDLVDKAKEVAKTRQLVNIISDERLNAGFKSCAGWYIKDIQILEENK